MNIPDKTKEKVGASTSKNYFPRQIDSSGGRKVYRRRAIIRKANRCLAKRAPDSLKKMVTSARESEKKGVTKRVTYMLNHREMPEKKGGRPSGEKDRRAEDQMLRRWTEMKGESEGTIKGGGKELNAGIRQDNPTWPLLSLKNVALSFSLPDEGVKALKAEGVRTYYERTEKNTTRHRP